MVGTYELWEKSKDYVERIHGLSSRTRERKRKNRRKKTFGGECVVEKLFLLLLVRLWFVFFLLWFGFGDLE